MVILQVRIVECAPSIDSKETHTAAAIPSTVFPAVGFFVCHPDSLPKSRSVSAQSLISNLSNFLSPLTCSQSNYVALQIGMFCSRKNTYPCRFAKTPTNVVHLVSLF